jgi:hypothetical protein
VDVTTAISGSAREPGAGDALLETALLLRPAEILIAQARSPVGGQEWARPASR